MKYLDNINELNEQRNECLKICFSNINETHGKIFVVSKQIFGDNPSFKTEKIVHTNNIDSMCNLNFDDSKDYYFSANSFNLYKKNRVKENLFALNNIVIDIDNHDDNNDASYIMEQCNLLYDKLERDIFSNNLIPYPNIIHFTGRGMQLWWHIDQASIKLVEWYYSARKCILFAIKNRIDEYFIDLEIDFAASNNEAGLYRLFCTKNNKINLYSQIKIINEKSYKMQDISKSYISLKENLIVEIKKDEQNNDVRFYRKTSQVYYNNYFLLSNKRILFIENLVNFKNNDIALKDLYLFIYYNELVKIHSNNRDYCKERTLKLNASFSKPSNQKDIEKQIFKYIDKKIFLKISNETLFEFLCLNESEKKLYFTPSIRNSRKEIKREQKRIEKKEIEDNNRRNILRLRKEGLTRLDIMRELDVSSYDIQKALAFL